MDERQKYPSQEVIVREPKLKLPALSSNNTLQYFKIKEQQKQEKEANKLKEQRRVDKSKIHLRNLSYRIGKEAIKAHLYVYKNLDIYNRKLE